MKQKTPDKKEKKLLTFEEIYRFLKARQKFINGFESGIFSIKEQAQGKGYPFDLARVAKVSDRKQLKILIPKQMLQKLPIVLAQLKTGKTSENSLNEIRQTT